MNLNNQKIQTALISVFDKNELLPVARKLFEKKIQIFSTNKTNHFLKKNQIITKNISEITQYPEILDGQIKTIHPKIFGGILGTKKNNKSTIKKYNITIIDLIIVNFYPLNTLCDSNNIDIVKNIDIGGPAMIRAAAKNYKNTIVIVDINDYQYILDMINDKKDISLSDRLKFAKKAFEYTANYDLSILNHLNNTIHDCKNKKFSLPEKIFMTYEKKQKLRYGENPHQKAALYTPNHNINQIDYINNIKQLNGSDLSYNNIYDAYTAFECVNQFSDPSCVIIKHGNPCGASSASTQELAYLNAYNTDSISAFGGIIGFNKIITQQVILTIIKKQFVELIIGPAITINALKIIQRNKKIKLIIYNNYDENKLSTIEYKTINHSLLVQETIHNISDDKSWKIVSKKKPNELEKKYAMFCWKITKFVKSNAIVYTNKYNVIAIGAGQTSRLTSVKIANLRYHENKKKFKLEDHKIIVGSDAFFPFRDSIDECKKNIQNISCIIQPGGSIRDQEVIQAVDEYQICMIFTHQRTFRH
ncbi:bifunctional phosphoribosylaminoimidazolecarboxamide formyltransferase/IMP cyclohydrolase [Buchnera aphidicola]|uniref:Bifunctional purine biosynthesis protein PurH n=1 Tax=Buchnera aphidicola (Sarucallis kahawaluokalani) TaxID=1241878 RepID=A0A4D6Y7G1_9GAMM|nr:bifunctional phosphoribosylaminoimidazolecarboxamide formyltransferase/IMP cyclohydrolase [Buchnera aphidicola]QCI25836.1 bifunctional phosphoribosylaminoimidazolecarboxamide formyltransferase/IMP cyclohydrolase PurH [Buchnera aphidicola (Sarucallis kahawaluokalani)]